jgi:YidC/Oxa1 family membrane protein insertase
MISPTLTPQMASVAASTIDGIISKDIFHTLLVHPLLNAIIAIYKLLTNTQIPFALGFALIILVLVMRKLMDPLYNMQTESSKKMQLVSPLLKKIQEEYKDNKEELSKKTMELYKEHGINPMSGCLPLLVQMPFIFGLYQAVNVLFTSDVNGKLVQNINAVLYSASIHITNIDTNFFGINLGASPSNFGLLSFYMLVPIITALLSYIQFTQTLALVPPVAKSDDSKVTELSKVESKDKKPAADDFQQSFNTQMKFMMPAMIGYFSWQFPVGLALYWNITTVYSIVQYLQNKKNNVAVGTLIEDNVNIVKKHDKKLSEIKVK